MKILFTLLLVLIFPLSYAYAQSPGETTETVTVEQLVHEVINGTFVVKKVPVEVTITKQIVFGG